MDQETGRSAEGTTACSREPHRRVRPPGAIGSAARPVGTACGTPTDARDDTRRSAVTGRSEPACLPVRTTGARCSGGWLERASFSPRRRNSMNTTRAAFLSRGAKGGIALVAGGSVLAATTGAALRCPDRGYRHREACGDRRAARDRLLHEGACLQEVLRGGAGVHGCRPPEREGSLQGARGRARVRCAEGPRVRLPGRGVQDRQEHRQARPGARDGLRRCVPRRGHGPQVERAEGRRGDDRRQRVPPPGDSLEHRRRHDRLGPLVPGRAHRREGDRSGHPVRAGSSVARRKPEPAGGLGLGLVGRSPRPPGSLATRDGAVRTRARCRLAPWRRR